jgi:HlyD family secretion protein
MGGTSIRGTTFVRAAALDDRLRPPANGHAAPPRLPEPTHSNGRKARQINPVTQQAADAGPHHVVEPFNKDNISARLGHAYDREAARGVRIVLLACCLGGALAWLVPVSGAVAVVGTVVTGSNAQKIQHPTGGVVDQILVDDGAHVRRGDVLLRMNQVVARSNLQVIDKQLDQARARAARLLAERDELERPHWPPELLARAAHTHVADLIAAEQAQFEARCAAYAKLIEILKQRAAQLEQERSGHQSQAAANEKQQKYVSLELQGLETLYNQQLVTLPRLSAVAREAVRLEGERAQLAATIAENASKIEETNLQISAAAQARRVDLTKEITEAHGKEAELKERQLAAKDAADRIELRAPQAGTVHQLRVHTLGGVVAAGETLMLIAPDDGGVLVEARLPPKEIDQIFIGQPATIRFSAFNRTTTPQLRGTLAYISPDVVHESQSDATYYAVRITLTAHELHRLGKAALRPGMPAEVFLETESRTLASYLLKPLSDQMQRMLRER